MQVSGEYFSRYELKYLLDRQTYQQFSQDLMPYMTYDARGTAQGKYSITTLYFESPDQKIYYETRNKAPFRQKLRLRIYNEATLEDQAFFEIKQKHRRLVNKRRTQIMLKDAYDFIAKDDVELDLTSYDVSNRQIMKEIAAFRQHYELAPKLIVSYDRQAFQGLVDEDLRVTFDYNLRCRHDDLHIEHGPHGNHFVDEGSVILEVKVTHSVPFWLSRLLSEYKAPKNSVSKFCSSTDYYENSHISSTFV